MHSSDIAFKPNDDGWGYTRSYASGWDRIFASKDAAGVNRAEAKSTACADQPSVPTAQQTAALEAAHACGALSKELLMQAKQELVARSRGSS